MNFNKMRSSFLLPLLLVALFLMSGCGSGPGEESPVTSVAFSDGSSVSIIDTGDGNYVLKGTNLNGVGGIEVSVGYGSSTMIAPKVTRGDFFSGALFAINIASPGVIRIAAVSTTPYSGSGPIATISLAGDSGDLPAFSLNKVEMIDTNGKKFQQL